MSLLSLFHSHSSFPFVHLSFLSLPLCLSVAWLVSQLVDVCPVTGLCLTMLQDHQFTGFLFGTAHTSVTAMTSTHLTTEVQVILDVKIRQCQGGRSLSINTRLCCHVIETFCQMEILNAMKNTYAVVHHSLGLCITTIVSTPSSSLVHAHACSLS